MELKERFLKYVSFDTQSDENSDTFPSTEKQKVLLACLADEMRALGMTEVTMDPHGYVMGTVPATKGMENAPVIGFIAHVDTSPDMSGADVKPRVIEDYDGSDIVLNGQLTMRVADFPELKLFEGHTLIHTDGTTLLGADDKAGVAEIMTAAEYWMTHPEAPHGKIRIGFTPDEEVGRGVDYFDVAAFGADFAYTVDGGFEGELEYENFNAAGARIRIQGRNVHPGYAKGKMLNAIDIACELNALLPAQERPSTPRGTRASTTAWASTARWSRPTELHHPRPRCRQIRTKEELPVELRRPAGEKVRAGGAEPPDQGPVLQHAQDGRTPSAGDRKGEAGDGDGRSRAHRAPHPRRYGRRPALVHGAPLPQPLHRRHEFPRQVRILLAHDHAPGRAGDPEPGRTVEQIGARWTVSDT